MIRRLVALLLLAVAVVLVLVLYVARLATVSGPSMEPALKGGDRVLALRHSFRALRRGDVVTLKLPRRARAMCGEPGGSVVKRIVALAGDRIAERHGRIVLNGRALREPYARRDAQTVPVRRIPRGAYWVLGDNRGKSCDSRVWGALPKRNVTGRVVATYWPPTRIGVR